MLILETQQLDIRKQQLVGCPGVEKKSKVGLEVSALERKGHKQGWKKHINFWEQKIR